MNKMKNRQKKNSKDSNLIKQNKKIVTNLVEKKKKKFK